jgi:hypothetical protein
LWSGREGEVGQDSADDWVCERDHTIITVAARGQEEKYEKRRMRMRMRA